MCENLFFYYSYFSNVKSSSGKNYSIPMCVHICLDFLKGSGTRFLLLVLSGPVYTEGGEGVGEAGGEDEPDWGDADRLRQAQPDPQVSKQSEQ